MSRQWRAFSADEVQALAQNPPNWARLTPRRCPACGVTAVRLYVHGSERHGRPTLISYTWCANCGRFHGSTGPRPPRFAFDDPLDALPVDQRRALEEDLVTLLDRLDDLWDGGTLPQRFVVAGQ